MAGRCNLLANFINKNVQLSFEENLIYFLLLSAISRSASTSHKVV